MLKHIDSISYRDTNQFPKLFLDYIDQKDELKEFYKYQPDLKGFEDLIQERLSFSGEQREILNQHLSRQYKGIEISERVKKNIDSLNDKNTFTICTGHQLNLFTGPLYFIYKILTVINLAEHLKNNFPDKHFVPVYWMASEDHDFEEIQFFNFEGKKYTWQSEQSGAVGKFSLENISDYLKSLPIPDSFKSFYSESATLAEAHLKLVNHLFSEYGLLVLDADSKALKQSFSDVIKKDIESKISFKNTEKSTFSLDKLGYNTPVNAREINYFYLDAGLRERIEYDGQNYFYSSNKEIQKIDLEETLNDKTEKLSPNVIARPLYQEYILPNLAYIGGPSELSYWLQLKSTFDELNVNFPLLVPRYSLSLLSAKVLKKMEAIKLDDLHLLFKEERSALKELLAKNDLLDHELHEDWNQRIETLFEEIKTEAIEKDKTLGPSAEGRKMKVLKELDKLRKKMETAEIRNQDILKNRFYFIKETLFPNGSFQERHDNIFEYLLLNEDIIAQLKNQMPSPLQYSHSLFQA